MINLSANKLQTKAKGSFKLPLALFILLLTATLLFLSACNHTKEITQQNAGKSNQIANNIIVNTDSFLSQDQFTKSIYNVKINDQTTNYLGIVVPHHNVASNLIAEAVEILSRQQPKIVFIVGPNHKNVGSPITTDFIQWQTTSGTSYPATQTITELINSKIAVKDENNIFATEHSIGTIMPFVNYYIPKAEIIPIVLHYQISLEQIKELAEFLKPHLEEGAVLIASIDFSHGLDMAKAVERDAITQKLMEKYAIKELMQLDNTYLDAPGVLALILTLSQGVGDANFTILANTNAGKILNITNQEVTSYFTLLFTNK